MKWAKIEYQNVTDMTPHNSRFIKKHISSASIYPTGKTQKTASGIIKNADIWTRQMIQNMVIRMDKV